MRSYRLATCSFLRWATATIVGFVLLAMFLATAPTRLSAADSDEEVIGRFIGETTVAVIKVDAARLKLPSADQLAARLPESLRPQAASIVQVVARLRQQILQAFGQEPFYIVVGVPASPKQIPVFLVASIEDGRPAAPAKTLLQSLLHREPVLSGRLLVVSLAPGTDTADQLAKMEAQPRPEFWHALRTVDESPIQLAVAPPKYVRRTIEDLMPHLPQEIGGGETSVWTKGVQWLASGVDPGALKVHVVIQSSSAEAAKALRRELPRTFKTALQLVAQREPAVPREMIEPLLADERFRVEGDRLVWQFQGEADLSGATSVLGTLFGRMRGQAERTRHTNRYKQVLLAMHNYYEVNRSLPPAQRHRSKDGKSVLSWRVHLLPYLDQVDLYKQFHLDEPWDSPHNIKLLSKMPDVYAIRRGNRSADFRPKPGYTTCVAPIGERTVMGQPKPVTFRDITDGTSNTVVLVEVDSRFAVPWTAPQDYEFDPTKPLDRIAKYEGDVWLAGMCDGSVQLFSADIAADVVLALFGMNDGQIIQPDQLR